VGIRGLLARTSFRPVESEYRVLYSRFTGQKNRGSVRHALRDPFLFTFLKLLNFNKQNKFHLNFRNFYTRI
jgi:hypothetical protein